MEATSTGFNPFSRNLDVASWRKSWNLRFANPYLLQSLKKAPDNPLAVYEKRVVSSMGMTFSEPLSCPLSASIALDDRRGSAWRISLGKRYKKGLKIKVHMTFFDVQYLPSAHTRFKCNDDNSFQFI